jgi:transcriptional regulator with XRE-family HTH domain
MNVVQRLASEIPMQDRVLGEWQFALAKRINDIRHEKGLSIEEFASKADLSLEEAYQIAGATANPTLEMLAKITVLLQVDILRWNGSASK